MSPLYLHNFNSGTTSSSGVFTWYQPATFVLFLVQYTSLWEPSICLEHTTKKNVMTVQIQPSCYFAAVQNLIYVVLCKKGATSHFGTKSAPQWTGMGSACIIIHPLELVLSHWTQVVKSSHPTMKLLSVQLFLCKHCLM